MHRPRSLLLVSGAAAAAFALLAAGCGGGSSAAVASVASSTTTTAATAAEHGLVGYARCMRAHGVPTFPDPGGGGHIPKLQVVNARSSNPSRFDSADATCRHLLPGGSLGTPETARQRATRLADGLSFARCMRSHDVRKFPDPTAQGQLSIQMVQAQGVDVHAPAFLHAVRTCLPASHGALTPAKVREALGNAGR